MIIRLKSSPAQCRHGFTLVEAVTTLALLAILAAGVKRALPSSNVDLMTETDRLSSHLRFAQIRAQADFYEWRVVFTDSTSYQIGPVVIPGPGFTPKFIPDSSGVQGVLRDGVTTSAGFTLRFDSWGRPMNDSGVLLSSDQTLTLSAGNQSETITILAHTGLIQ